jgi:diguanylate cyclase (GGDEF)-like protein
MGFCMTAIVDRPGLLARIAENPNLPTPPAIALRVLEKASEPDCTLADLESVIALDPALCVQLLRTVNSAMYGLPRAVTSIRLALGLLGTSAVRSLVLSLSLPALQGGSHGGEGLSAFWKSSVAGAIVARELAIRFGWPGPEDYLVAALLRDLGILVLPQVFPEIAKQLRPLTESELAAPPCEREEDIYGVNHAEVGAHLLRRWRMPAEITEAIRFHHDPRLAPALAADRARVLHFATKVALLQEGPPNSGLWEEVKELAANNFRLDEKQLLEFLEPLDRKMTEFAILARVDPGPCLHFHTILAAAAELGKLTMDVGLEHLRLREQRDQAEQEAGYWRRTASRFHREAVRDPLTGCYNRGYFEDALLRSFRCARRRSTPLGLLFIDLNNFKTLNDQHGHAFGDHALKSVAGRLQSCARTGDVVARFGGDEFCVITTPITEAGLRAMAERLRTNVAALPLRSAAGPAEARIAVGGAFCLPYRGQHTPAELLGAADAAMYEAKRCGSSGVRLTALLDEEDRRFLLDVGNRLFSTFLLDRSRVTAQDIADCPRPATPPPGSLARVARRLDFISRPELRAVLTEQRRSGRSFVEVALAHGALDLKRLAGLLALQRQPPEALADDLVSRGVLSDEESEAELQGYYAALRSG